MIYSPIVIITYSRIQHLIKTIESLKKNKIAKYSELYILSDAPKSGDEECVGAVRKYIRSIDGFKDVIISETKENNISLNFRSGVEKVFEKWDRMIFLEDDNVVSESFLDYMNNGLNYFKNDNTILAISGYNIPIKYPKFYKNDYYLSLYFNSWGCGTWVDRKFVETALYTGAYNELMADKKLYDRISNIHTGLIPALKRISEKKMIAGDYNLTYYSIKNNMYSVRPFVSYVNNIGHDGSGLNCKRTNWFSNQLTNGTKKIEFSSNNIYKRDIDRLYYKFFKGNNSLKKVVINAIKRSLHNFLHPYEKKN